MTDLIDDFFDLQKLINFYGITTDVNKCGYILYDGTMLNFWNIETMAVIEHYLIEKFYKKEKCDCKDNEKHQPICESKKNCKYGIRTIFLSFGNIRCIPDGDVIEIFKLGNSKCKKNLKNLIENMIFNLNKTVTIDIILSNEKNKRFRTNISLDKDTFDTNIVDKIERITNA